MIGHILKYATVATVIIALSSCTKIGRNITVKGRVLNPITGDGFEGVEIKLLKTQNLQYEGGYKAIQKVISDENGYYEISAMRTGPIYLISGEKGNNYSLGFTHDNTYYSMLKVDKGKTMNVDCHLVPYGNFQLKINNVNCGGGADTLIINQTNQVGTFLGIDWVIAGCNGYVTALEKVPMGTVHTKYTVIRNGVSNTYTVDFEVKPNQDNIQEINY